MPAYVVFVRSNTKDPEGLERYAELARLAPISKLELAASSKLHAFEVLEGPPTDAIVILRFPTMADAREWYYSDAYQKALPHRLNAAEFRTFLVEGAR